MNAVVHFDGGCRPNPGLGSYGYRIKIGKTVHKHGGLLGSTTSNIAEYCGLISALRRCRTLGVTDIAVYGDSKLIVQQVNKRWKTKNKRLIVLCRIVRDLLRQFKKWKIYWVPREHNAWADSIAEEVRSERA
jgi:ribonuclease H / adenosylcobalamin/alpha-ribazole phosphatase